MPPRRAKSQSISSDTQSPTPRSSKVPMSAAKTKIPSQNKRPSSPVAATANAISASAGAAAAAAKTAAPSPSAPVLAQGSFPLVVLLSFSLSSLLFTIVAQVTAGDLAAISQHAESWVEISGLLGWKVVQLGVCWFGGFGASDTIALILLMSTPHGLLLSLFYSIRPTTILFTTLANIISTTAPVVLMRRAFSSASTPTGAGPNRSIVNDLWTTIATTLLASAIFAVLLELSFATFLPVHLITHFSGVRDLSVTHLGAAGLPSLLAALIPAGYAARDFIFVSATSTTAASTSTPSTTRGEHDYTFDPATAGLGQHLYHNVWGWYSPRQKELIRRTTLLAVMVVGETIIHTWGTIKGVEFSGAVWYAAIWATGVATVGAVFDWVGEPGS